MPPILELPAFTFALTSKLRPSFVYHGEKQTSKKEERGQKEAAFPKTYEIEEQQAEAESNKQVQFKSLGEHIRFNNSRIQELGETNASNERTSL